MFIFILIIGDKVFVVVNKDGELSGICLFNVDGFDVIISIFKCGKSIYVVFNYV